MGGAKFVADATVRDGQVYAYSAASRPSRDWIITKQKGWGLEHLYTRLSPTKAIELVQKSSKVSSSLRGRTILDAVAELVVDQPGLVTWRFAFYLREASGQQVVAVVGDAKEGIFFGEDYGFGATGWVYSDIPLHLSDWVNKLVAERRWSVTNLK